MNIRNRVLQAVLIDAAGIILASIALLIFRTTNSFDQFEALVRTLLLAAPAILLTLLWPVAFGPRMWDTPPYGFDLTAFSWIVGIGLFFAASRFATKGQRSLSPLRKPFTGLHE